VSARITAPERRPAQRTEGAEHDRGADRDHRRMPAPERDAEPGDRDQRDQIDDALGHDDRGAARDRRAGPRLEHDALDQLAGAPGRDGHRKP
jgi:hypothetical protein